MDCIRPHTAIESARYAGLRREVGARCIATALMALVARPRVVGQARRFSEEIVQGVKRSTDLLKQSAGLLLAYLLGL
jgi:hypothetical protein